MTKLLLFAGLLFTAAVSYAQAPGTGGPTPNPAAVPLDGGSSLLVAAGVAYGVRQLRVRRAQRKAA
ncbi:MAG: hypothetical protein EOO56_07900 [Hymenobacter sp.]|nr:MAG: hypothetical protein EOO56_07900 [Hymenobacter sp.]